MVFVSFHGIRLGNSTPRRLLDYNTTDWLDSASNIDIECGILQVTLGGFGGDLRLMEENPMMGNGEKMVRWST